MQRKVFLWICLLLLVACSEKNVEKEVVEPKEAETINTSRDDEYIVPEDPEETARIEEYVKRIFQTYALINEVANEQLSNYNESEWMEFTNKTRLFIQEERRIFENEFNILELTGRNYDRAFVLIDLYIQIDADYITSLWNVMDRRAGSAEKFEMSKEEIENLFTELLTSFEED